MSKPNFIVVTKDFYKAVDRLEGRVQMTEMKKILRNTARKIYIPALKSASPGKGKLKASWGTVTGKHRTTATIFIGPRVPRGYNKMSDDEKRAAKYGGWVANILDFAKPHRRYQNMDNKSGLLRTPWGVRTSVGPIKKKTRFRIIMRMKALRALAHTERELKKLLER